ncbi:MAG TPA: hypothetical protein VLE49_07575 [Anaerolineales bacterium]|nr:hypothetical protein [Anaerolineales bacterium]
MPPTSNPLTGNLPGLILLILIISVPLALLTSIALLGLYRRAVIRVMRSRAPAGTPEPATPEAFPSSQEPAQTPLNIVLRNPTLDTPQNLASERLFADLLRGPWRAVGVYTLAGLGYALVTTVIFLVATKSGFHPLNDLILFWYYAWPIVVTVLLVAAATWRTRLTVFAIYFLIIAVLGTISLILNSSFDWTRILLLWFFTNLPSSLLLLIFLNRRIQAVGPLVLIFMIFAVTGLVFLPPLILFNERLIRLVAGIEVVFGLDAFGILLMLIVGSCVSFGAVGWFMLRGIGNLYQHKKISGQSITIDAIWLLFGIFQSIDVIFEGESWFLISLSAFVVYKIVTWVGFSILDRNAPARRKHPNLLLLRVFSLGKRSERLFDVLAMYWRYAGPIRLIAGPDLATATVEPHEFLEFLSGKLSRRFIDNARTLELRIAERVSEPDYDGQFRVNDFFCYDDTWRMVLSRLVGKSDVVLMDLRGFSAQNAGCIFEIGELINLMPLEQVLFIIDKTTDESFLRQVMQRSWEHRKATSPNHLSKSGLLHLFRLDGLRDREIQQLLQVLSIAANAAPKTQAFA